jgi:RsiW-degrading membrane proteinase PrsW (M82 family)
MGLGLSIFFGFAPTFLFACMLYWMDRYEKEPKILLGAVFFWGAVVASGAAFIINTGLGVGVYLLTGSEAATEFSTGSFIAPVIEESLKGFAILFIFLVFRKEFDSIIDGIIYAGIAALGFAATENSFYIYTRGFQENGYAGLLGLVFIRVILVGWQHPFYTSFTGIGLAVSRLIKNPAIRLIAPILGWMVAVFTHSFHNTISAIISGPQTLVVSAFFDWSGWFAMFIFMLWMNHRETRMITRYLNEEVILGNLTEKQFRIAVSPTAQTSARVASISHGTYKLTNRLYQICGELAHKKNQQSLVGDENGNAAIIFKLREELRHKSALLN